MATIVSLFFLMCHLQTHFYWITFQNNNNKTALLFSLFLFKIRFF